MDICKDLWHLVTFDSMFSSLLDDNRLSRLTVCYFSTKRLWSSWIRDGIMQFTGLYFAVLGGAYSSLAKANSRYVSSCSCTGLFFYSAILRIIVGIWQAKKAGSLAKRQIRLAQLVNDPVQECKCWLYYAEDLIHLGKLDRAKRILKAQLQYAKDNQNTLVRWRPLYPFVHLYSIMSNDPPF